MTKHERIESQKLAELESEWDRLLPECLKQCAAGRLGLFANSPVVSVFVDWPEAERVRWLANEITAIRGAFGSANPVCELFLHYCSLSRGSNARGEPKLAAEFLQELAENQ